MDNLSQLIIPRKLLGQSASEPLLHVRSDLILVRTNLRQPRLLRLARNPPRKLRTYQVEVAANLRLVGWIERATSGDA